MNGADNVSFIALFPFAALRFAIPPPCGEVSGATITALSVLSAFCHILSFRRFRYYLIYRTLFRHCMENNVLNELFNFSAEEVKYNCRVKSYVDKNGVRIPYEIMICDRFIFNPDGVVKSAYSVKADRLDEYLAAHEEIFLGVCRESHKYVSQPDKADNVARSKRRAKSKINDLIMCNDFDCFVTLTLDEKQIDRKNYGAVIKKLTTFLDNRVRRRGLFYVGVVELHKRGGLHFHFLCNSDALRLVDSGTVSVPGSKKPIKISTADRRGIPLDERHTVYNIPDWSLGFSTAIMTYGERAAVANYVGKYITKSDADKIGGRWYYSGGKLCRPVTEFQRVDFAALDDFSYSFDCAGGHFKVVRI